MPYAKHLVDALRSKHRVELRLPVRFEWKEAGHKHYALGTTRDISSEGLFVLSTSSLPLATTARCHLVLPSLQPNGRDLTYEAVVIGRVKRIELEGDQRIGFAVQTRVMVVREPRV